MVMARSLNVCLTLTFTLDNYVSCSHGCELCGFQRRPEEQQRSAWEVESGGGRADGATVSGDPGRAQAGVDRYEGLYTSVRLSDSSTA